jgi:hypothetical protein
MYKSSELSLLARELLWLVWLGKYSRVEYLGILVGGVRLDFNFRF